MSNGPWGGYQNGRIPTTAAGVAVIPWSNGEHIRREWLPGVTAFGAAFKKEFGYFPAIVEAYRSFSTQQMLWDGWQKRLADVPGYSNYNLAAWPGTSNHGWMEAIDFGSGINIYGSAQKRWADANGPKFGLVPAGNKFSSPEAWHFEWSGKVYAPKPSSKPAPKPSTKPTDQTINEEDDMPRNTGVYYNQVNPANKKVAVIYMIFNTGSGFLHQYSNGEGNGPMPGAYNNSIARAFDTPSWAAVTESHANVIRAALDAVRATNSK